MLTKYLNGPGIDHKMRVQNGSSVNYFLGDHLGSTNGLTDPMGNLTSQTAYDSFGNAANPSFPTQYRFTGREFDAFGGMQFSRARFYDPRLGRFISEDPIGFAGGDINLYGYVRNQPQWFRDPMGLQPGADVINPTILQQLGNALAVAGGALATYAPAAAPPVAVAAVGAAAIYGSTYVGKYTANHPSNPFVNGPWPLNPFKPPLGYPVPVYPAPTTASPTSQPYCKPVPRAIPFYRTPTIPWPGPPQIEMVVQRKFLPATNCAQERNTIRI